ncbi:nucleoporin GLE1-like [Mizuhopecten yessoensis]|uniref:mRNA export factor GLE1 n=1 Tax=Mizuhopecten yessoensis TaxID=6573 RepID=A0A210PQU4_MIZYE|nr:nucleoporin GLE1-like [Mizuhopecten yessoensis]OWF38806.1 Nucleoporin GLE1 [Mizuhopecten yessoensis]
MSTSRNSDIVVCLKNTPKGRLNYDRSRHVTKKFLDQCSSPPELKHLHDESKYRYINPNYQRKNQQQLKEKGDEEKQEKSEESSYDDSCEDSGSLDFEKLRIKTSPCKPALAVSPDFARSVKAIKEYEHQYDNRVKDALEKKAKEFQTHSSELQQKAQKQLKDLERKNIMKALQVQETTLLQHKKGTDESAKVQLKMQEDHRKHAQMLERKHEKIQEEIRKKEQEKKEREDKLKQLLTDLNTVQSRILTIQPKCAVQNKLADQCKLIVERIRKTTTDLENHIIHELQSGEINQSLPDKLKEAVMFALNAYEAISKRIEEENRKIEEEKAKAAAAAEAKRLEEQAKAAAAAAAPVATSTPIPSSSDKNNPSLTPGISPVTEASGATQLAEHEIQCVDIDAFQWYTKLQDNMKKTEELIKALSSPESKKLKFDLQKAVNTPINAISQVSGEHMREKLKRLLDLMSGKSVEVGSKRVSVGVHPQALTFCKYLAAKMFVKKGDEQVSSKHETAFATAMVFVGLWMEHPDIGELFLGHLHSACPYTVPYYIPRQEGQSSEDYRKALGYRYNSDGSVEKHDQFLKRMSGMMRLYAAILVAPPPPLRGTTNSHPYGVENAWIWLSRVMNIYPHPDITATMIYDMLHVAGNALYTRYGKQFQKLLYMLIKEYLPKLKQVATASGGGPLTRLETFLETCLKHNRQIPHPEGFLQADFWLSS